MADQPPLQYRWARFQSVYPVQPQSELLPLRIFFGHQIHSRLHSIPGKAFHLLPSLLLLAPYPASSQEGRDDRDGYGNQDRYGDQDHSSPRTFWRKALIQTSSHISATTVLEHKRYCPKKPQGDRRT